MLDSPWNNGPYLNKNYRVPKDLKNLYQLEKGRGKLCFSCGNLCPLILQVKMYVGTFIYVLLWRTTYVRLSRFYFQSAPFGRIIKLLSELVCWKLGLTYFSSSSSSCVPEEKVGLHLLLGLNSLFLSVEFTSKSRIVTSWNWTTIWLWLFPVHHSLIGTQPILVRYGRMIV